MPATQGLGNCPLRRSRQMVDLESPVMRITSAVVRRRVSFMRVFLVCVSVQIRVVLGPR